MSFTKFVRTDRASPLERTIATIQSSPAIAAAFYCLAGILVFATVLGGMTALTYRQNDGHVSTDLKGAQAHAGTAYVQGKTPWDRATRLYPTNSGVMLNVLIDGRPARTADYVDERTFKVKIGDTILVKYRVGRSGTIYIDDWQPMPR